MGRRDAGLSGRRLPRRLSRGERTLPKMSDENLPQRTLRTGFFLAGWVVLVLYLRGWLTASLGFAVGAALSLFSLWSLTCTVPRILREARPMARVLLVLLLTLKLPAYAVVLYYATTHPYCHPGALVAGIALTPAVFVLKTLGQALIERVGEPSGETKCRSRTHTHN